MHEESQNKKKVVTFIIKYIPNYLVNIHIPLRNIAGFRERCKMHISNLKTILNIDFLTISRAIEC